MNDFPEQNLFMRELSDISKEFKIIEIVKLQEKVVALE